MCRKNVIERLKLKNIDNYQKNFDVTIAIKGEQIYLNNKIKNLTNEGNKYKAIVEGTKDYKVEVEFDDEDKIKEMKCTCPYFEKEKNCKHTHSVVFAAKLSQYYPIVNNYIESELNSLEEDFKNTNFKNHTYQKRIIEDKIKELKEQLNYKKGLYQRLNLAVKIRLIKEEIKRTLYSIETEERKAKKEIQNKLEQNIKITKTKKHKPGILYGLISGLFSASKDLSFNRETTYTEKELDDWDLDKEQKQLVREGHYDPWNFEEENLEEEDYYYEEDE